MLMVWKCEKTCGRWGFEVLDDMKVTGKRKPGRPNETKGDTVREEYEYRLGVGVGGSVTAT